MARALLRNGHTVTMICGSYRQGNTGLHGSFLRGVRRGLVDGIDVIELGMDYANHMSFFQRVSVFVRFAWKSIRFALCERADLIFATTTPLTAGIPGIVSKFIRRKPFVFEVRDLWPELPRAMGVISNPVVLALLSALEWMSYKSADRLIGLSPGIVEGIALRNISRQQILMIPNGSDLGIFSGQTNRAWRPEGVPEDRLLAVFSGTHGNANGLDSVINAAAVLKTRGRDDLCIVLVGDGSEKVRLMKRVKDEKLSHLVLFLDPIPKLQLNGLLAGADIGLQILRNVPAFYYGTSPNKFFDYIAAGLPVLCNYPGWLCQVIQEHECGFVVPPDNAADFASALEEAANNRFALREMGRRASLLAHTSFDREKLANQWVKWVTTGQP